MRASMLSFGTLNTSTFGSQNCPSYPPQRRTSGLSAACETSVRCARRESIASTGLLPGYRTPPPGPPPFPPPVPSAGPARVPGGL